MKKNIIKGFCKKSTLSLLMVFVYLISLTYTSGVYALGNDPVSVDFWDGTDNYTSLSNVLADLGSADENGYYHIKTANQLHAVIKYNGGGNKYKLDNNLYLNEDYKNSANWSYTNSPANEWSFNSSGWTNPQYKFYGTIDGCGYTVYGLYSNNDLGYNGLIGTVYDTTVIKNLNVWNSYVRGVRSTGIIIGGNFYNSPSTASITVEGCSVRYAVIDNVWDNSPSGGIIGITTRPTTINNCYVADVKFTSGVAAGNLDSSNNAYGCMGSFVGALYNSTSADTSVYNVNQGKIVTIKNSYAVNVVNASDNNTPVYICGIYRESATKYCFSITANNVYTDATKISENTAGTVKLLVSDNGANAVNPDDTNYPVKTVLADAIKGDNAKTVMSGLNWHDWHTVANDYPVYVDSTPENVWDGTDTYTSLNNVLEDLGAADESGYYHIKTANQLHAVIKYNGGGNKYKLDNDIYLNADYKNSENWTYANSPSNEWKFVSDNWTGPAYKFSGTIDGCGHTVYGLYSNDDKAYNGLIGTVYDTTVIKNLNVWHSYVRSVRTAGILIGGNFYNSPSTASITVENCSVRYATIDNVWNNAPSGGIIGVTTRKTEINNCAVADVKFISCAAASDHNAHGCLGSFVGALYANTSAATNVYNGGQGKQIVINNSYAVNVINASKNNTKVYPCGLYCENLSRGTWTFSITANNVYTDATEVSSSTAGNVKLLVSTDKVNAISPADSNYPIKEISSDSIIGIDAKTAMPALDWCKWSVIENDYPSPQGGHSLAHNPAVDATCADGGTLEYWTCIECNKKFSDADGSTEITTVVTTEAINHKNAQHFEEDENSCTEDGNIEYWYCPDCKKYSNKSDFSVILEESQVIVHKTNHLTGKMHYTAADASCEEDGHIEYWHCTDCDKYYTDENCQNEVSKESVVTERATGHKNTVFRPATEAGNTCLESGTVAHYECTDCNKKFSDAECKNELVTIESPSDKHYGRKVSEKAATCYESGTAEHFECIYCHKLFEDENCKKQTLLSKLTIPEIAHSVAKYVPETYAGCTSIGLKEHWYCKSCDSYFVNADLSDLNKVEYSKIIIPATGHTVSDNSSVDYDTNNHWQLCDKCGIEQNIKPHKLSSPVSVGDGNQRHCDCGYVLKEFLAEQNSVKVFADYGVFSSDTKISVEKLRSGMDYNQVISALPDTDSIEIYKVSASRGMLRVTPKGKVTVEIPVSKGYSGNVAIYSLGEDGTAKRINADIDRANAVATLDLYGLGTFVVADLGVDGMIVNTDREETENENSDIPSVEIPKTGESNALIMFVVTAIVAGFIIITDTSYKVLKELGKEE